MQASMPTSGAVQRHHMEAVVRSWWGPSASRANVPRMFEEALKFAMDDDAETAREKAAELAQNAQSTAAAAGSVANGASIQGQAAAAVLAAEREAWAPVTHQERRRRSEVSEEEFERRQALVKHQSFWAWLTFQVERESQLLV